VAAQAATAVDSTLVRREAPLAVIAPAAGAGALDAVVSR
jgi:hypothetical protein